MAELLLYKKRKIKYKVKGGEHSRSIVLLHGFLESMKIWHNLERHLSEDYRVISIDLPGFGKSDSIDVINNMQLMADVVNKILVHNNVNRCVMVGHSMGGYVALSFAERFASKLKGLVLFHSHAMADTPEAKVNRNRMIHAVKSDHSNFIYQFIGDLFAPSNAEQFHEDIQDLRHAAMKVPRENVIAALEGMKLRTDKLHVLADSTFPVLFIAGKQDSRIPVASILEQALLPKHSELVILSDVGHMGFLEARKKTERIIHAFAERVF